MDKRVASGCIVGASALLCFVVVGTRHGEVVPRARVHTTARVETLDVRREEIRRHQRTRDPQYDARLEGDVAVAVNETRALTVRVSDAHVQIRAEESSAEVALHLAGVGR